mmetsp:Transcript_24463/g.55148  ORF Transcript_24463/g.55148 Transcript_24463/m.55148 type:complete len:485 (-) Transcript_24463:786-2240(-)
MVRRKPKVLYLYPALLLYSVTLFASFAPRTILTVNLLRLRICGHEDQLNHDNEQCDEDKVSSSAAFLSTLTGLASAIPQILVAGPMGSLANRHGRRIPAILAVVGTALYAGLVAMVARFKLNPEWLIAGSLVEGATGSFTSFLMCTSTYVADLNTFEDGQLSETQRGERFSFLEAMLSIGVLLGPICGGYASELTGYYHFFLLIAALGFLLCAYLFFIVPETLHLLEKLPGGGGGGAAQSEYLLRDNALAVVGLAFKTRPLSAATTAVSAASSTSTPAASNDALNGASTLTKPLTEAADTRVPGVHLARVSVAFMLLFGASNSGGSLLILYSERFWGWGSVQIGTFVSFMGGMGTLQLLGTRRAYKLLTGEYLPDLSFMRVGAASAVLFNLFFALLDSPTAAYALVPLVSFQFGATPSYRKLYSEAFPPEDQSRIFAAVSMLESAPWLIAPLVYNQIYALTVKSAPNVAFFFGCFHCLHRACAS